MSHENHEDRLFVRSRLLLWECTESVLSDEPWRPKVSKSIQLPGFKAKQGKAKLNTRLSEADQLVSELQMPPTPKRPVEAVLPS